MAIQQSTSTQTRQFSASAVTRVLKQIGATSKREARERWLQAVAARVVNQRPDLADDFCTLLNVVPARVDILADLTIGEISVCYEALLASLDPTSRKNSGQYFTPDDAAQFMAEHSRNFGEGVWMDPCCGVGNLAWHLTNVQSRPAEFVRDRLVLIDQDPVALQTAIALIGAEFLASSDADGLRLLQSHAVRRDFLSRTKLPDHNFVIVNPPYARAALRSELKTGATKESFSYFMEKIAENADGFISVTPASYVSAPKFGVLREIIEAEFPGGDVYVFDNVPDTLFRGYKFGSTNTSKTNFVRAAITVCSPSHDRWRITPIIRWRSASRAKMFANCASLLSDLRKGRRGEWAKLAPGLESLWDWLVQAPQTIGDLVVKHATPHSLTVALTPRYYISASYRPLNRGSKAVLHFRTEEDRDRAALVLNSSIPYIWWRALDGGVTLPRRVLDTTPVPRIDHLDRELLNALVEDEEFSLVIKMNAGKPNENIKRPLDLVAKINDSLLPDTDRNLGLIYSEDMFTS